MNMPNFFRTTAIASLAVGALMFFGSNAVAQNQNVAAIGKQIFTHVWKPGDSKSPRGDGLGPLFNGRSCFECHHQGGIGGGGDLKQNVDLVSTNSTTPKARQQLISVHPGFVGTNGQVRNSIVLHRFSLDQAYSQFRSKMLVFDGAVAHTAKDVKDLERAIAVQPIQPVKFNSRVGAIRSQRNPTAIFGAGLIDQITDNQLAGESIQVQSGLVSGRVSVLSMVPQKFGRFGWRAQTSTLREFVIGACATELGLESSSQSQSADPRNPHYRAPGVDITDREIDALVQFVVDLPRPVQVLPTDPVSLERVERGHEVFTEVGCTDCHVRTRVGIEGIYSDLLLHDMGKGLADPVGAPSTRRLRFGPGTVERGVVLSKTVANLELLNGLSRPAGSMVGISYYEGGTTGQNGAGRGGQRVTTSNRLQEWRTPPLWGVEASSPYMHDGRAKTLIEAIVVHGGEAQDSVHEFMSLPQQDQLKLIEFLKTLKAPK